MWNYVPLTANKNQTNWFLKLIAETIPYFVTPGIGHTRLQVVDSDNIYETWRRFQQHV